MMLQGSATVLAFRAPLVFAHMFIFAYPWVPDIVTSVQLTSGLFLPPCFHAAGVGASADDVSAGHARLLELIASAAAGAPPAGAAA